MPDAPMPEVRHNKERLRYEVVVDGRVVGFVQYNVRGGRIVLTHTEVDRAFGGRGLATALAKGALDDIRRRGRLVVPVCPFMESYIAKHPEYDDLVDHELFDAINAARES
jgi:predicted GNAT family acetyltransferase